MYHMNFKTNYFNANINLANTMIFGLRKKCVVIIAPFWKMISPQGGLIGILQYFFYKEFFFKVLYWVCLIL
jgi:hypothetical protein